MLEPRWLVALTDILAGGEHLRIVQLWSGALWAVEGLGIYTLAARMRSPNAGHVSPVVHLLLPYGVIASGPYSPILRCWR